MQRLAEGVFIDRGSVGVLGTTMPVTMTALQLHDGLLLFSPLAMTPQRRDAVAALGDVKYLFAPNTWHHMYIGEWAEAFPDAAIYGPPGLQKKRKDLRIDHLHGTGDEPHISDLVELQHIDGFFMQETALYYRPAKAWLVADLVQNIGRPADWWSRTYSKMAGFYDEVALSRVIRWTAFNDRAAARRSVDRLLAEPFERLLVGHGEPVIDDARSALARAYDWLAPAPALQAS